MIALDTNALVRLLIEDDIQQADAVKKAVSRCALQSEPILILTEVLIETVWVLESIYTCERREIVEFLNLLLSTAVFTFTDHLMVRNAVMQYQEGGDYADLLIVAQCKRHKAKKLISFDKQLQRRFPEYVLDK